MLVSRDSLPANFSLYQAVDAGWKNIGNGIFMPLFSNVSRGYSNRDAITILQDGPSCAQNSTCKVNIPATGFDVSCSDSSIPLDANVEDPADPAALYDRSISVFKNDQVE